MISIGALGGTSLVRSLRCFLFLYNYYYLLEEYNLPSLLQRVLLSLSAVTIATIRSSDFIPTDLPEQRVDGVEGMYVRN